MPTPTQLFVSVLIPNYNRKEDLTRAIDSVLAQTYTNFEILVIDDHSSFSNEEYLSSVGYAHYKNLRVIRNEKNMGLAFTRNVGIQHAKGELIALLDSDDFWEKDKLEKQVQIFEKFPDTDLVYCDIFIVKDNVKYTRDTVFYRENLYDHLLSGWNPPNPSSLVIKKGAFSKIGGFDPILRHHEDYDFWFRLAKANLSVRYSEERLSNFSYDSPDRLSNTYKVKFDRTNIFLNKWEKEISSDKGKRNFADFKQNLITRMAIETFVNSIKIKKLLVTLDVYFHYLTFNRDFYKLIFRKILN